MAFARFYDLFINCAKGSPQGLLRNKLGLADADTPKWMPGDKFTLRLHFCDAPGTDLNGFNGVALAAGDTIVLGARPADDLDEETLLFSASAFTEVLTGVPLDSIILASGGTDYVTPPTVTITGGGGTGAAAIAIVDDTGAVIEIVLTSAGSGYTTLPDVALGGPGTAAVATAVLDGQPQYRYEALLDLNTVPFLAATTEAAGQTLAVLCDVEVRSAGNTERLTFQFPLLGLSQVYKGTEGVPTSGSPVYPAPEEIALCAVLGKYRIKADGTVQLWNGDQAKFHTLTISGLAGAEVLNIAAGED